MEREKSDSTHPYRDSVHPYRDSVHPYATNTDAAKASVSQAGVSLLDTGQTIKRNYNHEPMQESSTPPMKQKKRNSTANEKNRPKQEQTKEAQNREQSQTQAGLVKSIVASCVREAHTAHVAREARGVTRAHQPSRAYPARTKLINFTRRTIASILTVASISTIIAPVYATNVSLPPTPPIQLGAWADTSSITAVKMDKDAALTWITGELTRISSQCSSLVDSTTTADTAGILASYGSYLSYLHWVTSNEVKDSTGQAYSVFTGPPPMDSKKGADAITIAETLQAKIIAKGLLNSTTDITAGLIDQTPAVTFPLPSASALAGADSLLGNDSYGKAVGSIVENYADAGVLAVLAGEAGVTASTYAELKSSVDSALNLTGNVDKVAELATKYKDKLLPFLNVYNQVSSTFTTIQGRALGVSKLKVGTKEVEFQGYQSTKPLTSYYSLSATTSALYGYMFAATTTKPNDPPPTVIPEIDVTDGVLPLMSNAHIIDGRVTASATPELTNLGYIVVGAGIVYDPFVSYVGNDLYLETIKRFLGNNSQQDDVIKIVQHALNTKKPLYVVEGQRDQWTKATDLEPIPVGEYRLAFLQDLLQVDQEVTRAYSMIKGKMLPSVVDSSTWEYVNNSQPISTNGNTKVDSGASKDGLDSVNGTDMPTAEVKVDGTASTTTGTITVGTKNLIASSSQMTTPVMYTTGRKETINPLNVQSSSFPDMVGGLTSVIIHNAVQDSKANKHIQNAKKEMLFVNGIGDIVLEDNTVVLPAIANPLLFHYDVDTESTEKTSNVSGHAYYPYNAAFMNHYPGLRVSTEGAMIASSSKDVNKFVIFYIKNALTAKRIKSSDENKAIDITWTGGVAIPVVKCNGLNVTGDPDEVQNALPAILGDSSWTFLTAVTDGVAPGSAGDTTELGKNYFLVRQPIMNELGINLFPITFDNADMMESYLDTAAPLVTSVVRYISVNDEGTGLKKSTDAYRVPIYITEVMGEALLGTQYANTMVKNYKVSYDEIVADTSGRLLTLLTQVTESAINTLGNIDGVLAIKDAYGNSFFNIIMGFIRQFYLFIALVLLIVVAIKFLKGRYKLFYVCLIGLLVAAGFEVYAMWMPTLLPNLYNLAVNDAVESIVWNTVTSSAESYQETYKDSSKKDPTSGLPKPYTTTITLYKLTHAEMKELADQQNIPLTVIEKGTPLYLDETAGIFVQGDSIKMSVDKLFVNNTIRGLYQSQWDELDGGVTGNMDFIAPIDNQLNDNPYSIQLTSPYVSLESYYTPYCQIERAFMVNLNTLCNIFRIERNSFSYGKDIHKDAFLVNAFTNSGIFTSPGNDSVLSQNIRSGTITGSITASKEQILELCHRYFDPMEDWLNLRSIFAEPSEGVKDSLWGQMLQDQNYYDSEWKMDEEAQEKMTRLILYINDQTKRYIINNQDQINFCSDENAIKLISLFATTAFTQEVSQFGKWLYPNYLNACDISLKDVLYGSMTTLKDRNFAYDGTVVNTVALNLGIFGVLFILLITVFSTVFIFIITYLVPVLYGLFGVILVYKLINDEQSIGLIKGYFKVTLTTVLLYFLYSLGLQLVSVGGYHWYGYLASTVVSALCLYVMLYVLLSIVQDVSELGNNTLMANLLKAGDNLTRGAFKKIQAQAIEIKNHGTTYNMNYGGARAYRRSAPMDERYQSYGGAGIGGRNSYYDEDYGRSRGQRGSDRHDTTGYGRYDNYNQYSEGRSRLSAVIDHARDISNHTRRRRQHEPADESGNINEDRSGEMW